MSTDEEAEAILSDLGPPKPKIVRLIEARKEAEAGRDAALVLVNRLRKALAEERGEI